MKYVNWSLNENKTEAGKVVTIDTNDDINMILGKFIDCLYGYNCDIIFDDTSEFETRFITETIFKIYSKLYKNELHHLSKEYITIRKDNQANSFTYTVFFPKGSAMRNKIWAISFYSDSYFDKHCNREKPKNKKYDNLKDYHLFNYLRDYPFENYYRTATTEYIFK